MKTYLSLIIGFILLTSSAFADETQVAIDAFSKLPRVIDVVVNKKNPFPNVKGDVLQVKTPEVVSFYGFCGNSYACDLTVMVIQRVIIGYKDDRGTYRAEEYPIVGLVALASNRKEVASIGLLNIDTINWLVKYPHLYNQVEKIEPKN